MSPVLEAHFLISLTAPITVLSVTEDIEELLGFKASDFLAGKVSLKNQIHAHDQDIAGDLFSIETNKTPAIFNIRIRQANGRIRCIKGHYSKKPDASGTDVVLQLLLQDAKSLSRNQSLSQSLGKQAMIFNFKAMMENTDDYIYFKDSNHVFTGASQTLVAITEPTEHWTDLLGLTDYDVFTEEYADIYYRLEKQVFSGVPLAHEEQETLDNKGNRGWVDNRKYPIKNEQGEIVGLFGIARDITERKRMEDELKASEARFRSLIENSPLCIHELDRGGKLSSINRAGVVMMGAKDENTLLGKSYMDAVCVSDRKNVGELLIKAYAGQTSHFEFKVSGSSGQIFKSCFVPIMNSHGVVEKLMGITEDISERKIIENELKQTKERYDYATRVGKVGTWDWNPVTGDLAWSDETFRLLGLMPSSVTPSYEMYLGMVHPEDREFLNNAVQAAMYEKKPYDIDCRILPASGGELVCHVYGIVEFDEKNQPIRMLGTIQDITERKQAQDALKQGAARIEMLLNSVAEGIYGVDMRGNCTFINSAGLHLLGYQDESELIGKHIHELIHHTRPDGSHYPSSECRLYACLHSHADVHIDDELFWRKDGNSFPVDYWSRPIMQNGEHGAVITFLDITGRKKIETDLRVAATVFESQEGMLVSDANNSILRVNRAFTHITGYSAEEVIGRNPRILQSGRQDTVFYTAMWRSINDTGTWDGEVWNRRKNGEIFPEHLTITAVKDQDGNVTNYVATLFDITLSKAAADEIEHLAFYDPLTGLPNRRLLMDRLKPALASSHRSGRKCALLFIDLDNFKALNDTLGHDYGDLLLQQVAERLTSCVREVDTVARLGGDEFVVMLEDLSEQATEAVEQTEVVGNKILTLLNQPYLLATYDYRSTPSIGATLFDGHEQFVDELLKQADIAMYHAKASGRNTLRFFDQQMQVGITARVAMDADLRQALAENQFEMYYQLQINHNSQVVGAEGLIRWHHPQRGLLSPTDFIPMAEENGLILPIGLWVLETACAQLKIWENSEHTRCLQLAVNVSARQFHQPDFVAQVNQVLLRHAINPSLIKLELTESLVLDDIDDTVVKMNALRKIGVHISMDDFGTGHSSLSSLRKLPLDQLKIDQSFVGDILSDPGGAVIVKTIIAMANSLGIEIIAEGVETEAQRAFLEQNDCSLCQGYLFSKPVPIELFEQLIKTKKSVGQSCKAGDLT